MGRVDSKACVVTGAGSGIGKAIAERLAEEGGKVLCVDLNGDTAAAVADGIKKMGGIASAVAADVSDRAQVDAFIAQCVAEYSQIDVLVNNAGVNIPGVFHEVPDAVIDKTLNVNVKGVMYGCQAAIPHMLK